MLRHDGDQMVCKKKKTNLKKKNLWWLGSNNIDNLIKQSSNLMKKCAPKTP